MCKRARNTCCSIGLITSNVLDSFSHKTQSQTFKHVSGMTASSIMCPSYEYFPCRLITHTHRDDVGKPSPVQPTCSGVKPVVITGSQLFMSGKLHGVDPFWDFQFARPEKSIISRCDECGGINVTHYVACIYYCIHVLYGSKWLCCKRFFLHVSTSDAWVNPLHEYQCV